MGRSRYRIPRYDAPHFLTCTVLHWLPLFTRPETVDILLEALVFRQQQAGWRLYGYVILENHMHCIVQTDRLPSGTAGRASAGAVGLVQETPQVRPGTSALGGGESPAAYGECGGTSAEAGVYSLQPGEARVRGSSGALAVFQCTKLLRAGGSDSGAYRVMKR